MTLFAKLGHIGAFISFVLLGADHALAQQLWVPCKPVEAAAFPNRVHMKCAAQVDARFWYFATSTSDPRLAARVLSVIESAQLGDKYLSVLFDPSDQSGTAFGCQANDCRNIVAVIMVESPMKVPSTCAFDTNRQGCPGYCSSHPNDHSCPAYCSSHPDDKSCPGYCKRHPHDDQCDTDCVGGNHNPMCQDP
jgi:hypothetical protein